MLFKLSIRTLPGTCLVFIVFICLVGACLDPIPRNTIVRTLGSLTGTVLDKCSEIPTPDVEVIVQKAADTPQAQIIVRTDPSGHFQLQGLADGKWEIATHHPAYLSSRMTIDIFGGNSPAYTLYLTHSNSEYPTKALLDVLLVIDNSTNMGMRQQSLTSSFPSLVEEMIVAMKPQGGDHAIYLNFNIGVISTDLGAGELSGEHSSSSCFLIGGDGGKLQNKARLPDCTTPRDQWIWYENTSELMSRQEKSNIPGKKDLPGVSDVLTCIGSLGEKGCTFEQPLGVIRRALDPALGINAGFLREGAALVVIVLTDEDDCSPMNRDFFFQGEVSSFQCTEQGVTCDQGIQETGIHANCRPTTQGNLEEVDLFIDWLNKLKNGRVFFSAIAGPSEPFVVDHYGSGPNLKPSCSNFQVGSALPAVRLKAVSDGLGERGSFDSICTPDMKDIMASIARRIVNTVILRDCPNP